MKTKEEIRIKWIRHTPLMKLDECVDNAMQEYSDQQNKKLLDKVSELENSLEINEKLRKEDTNDFVKALNECENEKQQLQSRIDELQKGNEWISVELNTVPINTPILCYQNNNYNQFRKLVLGYDGKCFRDFYNGDDDDILFNGNGEYIKITHWMPLPNKPKTN